MSKHQQLHFHPNFFWIFPTGFMINVLIGTIWFELTITASVNQADSLGASGLRDEHAAQSFSAKDYC